jgi:F-type H+-transporting ATPase subunit a
LSDLPRHADSPEPTADEATEAEREVVAAVQKVGSRLSNKRLLIGAAIAVLVLDVVAGIVVPAEGFPNPGPGITSNLEFIPPHVLIDLAPGSAPDSGSGLVLTVHPSITSTMLMSWLVIGFLLIGAFLLTRRLAIVPGRVQAFLEMLYEGLTDFAMALGGPPARRYVPLFVALFLFIITANWSGLLPLVGKIETLRAPTSDVNITFGLALVSFITFHYEGMRELGVRGYLGKFFNLRGFKRSAFDGSIDLFVGLLEFFLEFFKPLTLALRLFANIYGGEVVLGVMTALLLAILPLPFLGLELFVGFMQALVFAILTLTFTLIAIEAPHDVEHAAHEGDGAAESSAHHAPAASAA